MSTKDDEFFEAWIQQRKNAPEASVADSVMSRIEAGEVTNDSGDPMMAEVPPKTAPRLPSHHRGRWLLLAAKYSAIAAAMLLGVIRLSLFLMPFSELQ